MTADGTVFAFRADSTLQAIVLTVTLSQDLRFICVYESISN